MKDSCDNAIFTEAYVHKTIKFGFQTKKQGNKEFSFESTSMLKIFLHNL